MRLFFIILAALLLSSCSSRPARMAPLNKHLTWDDRSKANACVTRWQIKGATSIKTPDESLSASLNWHQEGPYSYHIVLLGPMGSGSMTISREGNEVSLLTSDGHNGKAASAEDLMQEELQWSLPVSDLYYWIRGLPAPGSKSNMINDTYNHLQKLEQKNWAVDYLRYTNVDGLDLPSKIYMNHDDINVRIVISKWEIEKNCIS